ncbi:MAG TPA: PDZ domain-containing protein [Gemmatimonadaceae bacterium]|nr:PDZ domain-containing protein [Gemmatimonadaceae bacterium]
MSLTHVIRRSVARALVGAVAAMVLPNGHAVAQQLEPIRYVVRIPEPQTHYIEVQATYPASRQPVVELMMAVWTPGSYLVREFARHVEQVRASDPSGRALPVEKSRKNRWRVETRGAAAVVLTYRVYALERQARTNWVEESFALINGAPTFITLVERTQRPHEVALELPDEWSRSLTSLPVAPGGRPHHYRAPDYDTLADSPIVAGNPTVHELTVDGVPHALVNVGEAGVWDGARSARDVRRIVEAARVVWGSFPYERYLFFNMLVGEGGDGIEHKGSTVLVAGRWSTRDVNDYRGWLGLVAHEFFHAWNVKRLRPVELGPFDYENEVYSRSLWIAEGVTDYYGTLLVRRAGLATREEALEEISAAIRSLQTTPGRLVQPLELASFDAWIKHYRRDENSPNVAISYYTKGSVVGLLLDAKVRRLTNGARSLDDVMRLAYRRYSGARGYTPAQFRAVAAEVAGAALDDFFHRALETTEELDYQEMLDWYGLRFVPVPADEPAKPWLGADVEVEGDRIVLAGIRRGTPVYGSGVAPGDELLAIDDFAVSADELDERLERYQPGDTVTLTVSRRDQLRRYPVKLGAEPLDRWSLEVKTDATAEQRRRLAAWLGPEDRRGHIPAP